MLGGTPGTPGWASFSQLEEVLDAALTLAMAMVTKPTGYETESVPCTLGLPG